MADDGGISDNAIVNEVRHEPSGNPSGWTALGHALGGGLGGANTIAGENAYEGGMRVGAQTADALAQARDRIQKSDAADQAAAAMRNPQFQQQMGWSQELGNYFATQAQMGKDPKEVTGMALQNQEFQHRARIADTSQPLDARHAAAFAQAPASMAPKAEGPLGSTFDPGANGGSGATTVGGPQMQLTQSEIDKNKATGDAATELATQRHNNPMGAGGKLQTGFRWKMNPDNPGEIMTDENGTPIQEANPAAGTSAVSRRYSSAVVNSAALVGKEAQNVAKLGEQTDRGGTQMGGTHTGIMNTIGKNLGLALSSDDQQEYETSLSNIGRALTTIEGAGRQPNQATVATLDKLINSPGTTQNARLYNFALIRQIVEAGGEGMEGNDDATPSARAAYAKALASITKSIPYTPADVIDFRREGGNMTFKDYLASKQKGAGGGTSDLPPGFKVVN